MKQKLYAILFLVAIVIPAAGQGINRLWGLTPTGGATMFGTMFSTDGAGQNIISNMNFPEGIPGMNPASTKLQAYNGKLYGVTTGGGSGIGGVIFSWDPTSLTYHQEYQFRWESGSVPYGSLVLKDGIFYGMTSEGGASGEGVIFSWNPQNGDYTRLFSFSEVSGKNPYGSLSLVGGKFYGLTSNGGVGGFGAIFEWDLTGNTYTRLHDFSETDGAFPIADLLLFDGKLYGMTPEGGENGNGVVFVVDNGVFSVLHHFESTDGSTPRGSLVEYGGKLFGLTSRGGQSGDGVLFELSGDVLSVIYEFSEAEGSVPQGSLEINGDQLYGMTSRGGANGGGVIFEWDLLTDTYTSRYDFVETTGWKPEGSLLFFDGRFFGMTFLGGDIDGGVLFEWNSGTGIYNKLSDFIIGELTGMFPLSNATPWGGSVFATTAIDLSGVGGSIFQWNDESKQYALRHVFSDEENGMMPYGEMQEVNGKFYGLTAGGGAYGAGVIFEWDPTTEGFRKRHDFAETFQGVFIESFIGYNGRFYGASSGFGSDEKGLLFEWDPEANGGDGAFYERFLFPLPVLSNAASPSGITLKGDKIYGIASSGGVNNNGVIFEWDPVQGTIDNRLDVGLGIGAEVIYTGAMTLKDDRFYGTALVWDPVEAEETAILFEWNPDTNLFLVLHNFDPAGDMIPSGTLAVNNGKLYGVAIPGCGCEEGRSYVYEWNPAKSTFTKGAYLEGADGLSVLPEVWFSFLRLVPAPVPVGKGTAGDCVAFSVLIDASNNEEWVPVTDSEGKAVAEINANGNILGNVTVNLFVNEGAVREDGSKRLYLDRNITISPEYPDLLPDTKVDVRLYIHADEYTALATAENSDGQASGINGASDIGLFKSEANTCSDMVQETAVPLDATIEDWNQGYVLQTSVNSFSTFYFASAEHGALPVRLLRFQAILEEENANLTWQTEAETDFSHIEIERSADGKKFVKIGSHNAKGGVNGGRYAFTDTGIKQEVVGNMVYYRLKLVDTDASFVYSNIVSLSLPVLNPLYVYPNPATEYLSLRTNDGGPVVWQIVDASGRTARSGEEGGRELKVKVGDLAPGVYHLMIRQGEALRRFRFAKY